MYDKIHYKKKMNKNHSKNHLILSQKKKKSCTLERMMKNRDNKNGYM